MKRIIPIAALLLIIQIALAVVLNITDKSLDSFTPEDKLLNFVAAAVDSITLYGEGDKKLVMEKQNSAWVLPDTFSALVNVKQLTALLDKLSEMKQGLAVATSKEAAQRFKVAEEVFERHVLLRQDGKVVADFYIGTSPGFRQVHARVTGRDEIVTVGLSAFELGLDADSWIDKNVLHIKDKDIEAVKLDDISLERVSGEWQLQGLQDNQTTNREEVKALLSNMRLLTIQTVVDPTETGVLFKNEPFLRYTLILTGGNSVDYIFAKSEQENYLLKVSNSDFVFQLNKWALDDIKKVTRDRLVHPADEELQNDNDTATH